MDADETSALTTLYLIHVFRNHGHVAFDQILFDDSHGIRFNVYLVADFIRSGRRSERALSRNGLARDHADERIVLERHKGARRDC